MWHKIWPIFIAVSANTMYNICAKSTPDDVSPFASLSITYLMAAVCSAAIFFLTKGQQNLAAELSKCNWTSYVLGISIVGLEYGFLCIYRAGWKIGVGNLVASVALACVLLLAGVFLYKETLSLRQLIGMGICAVGLILVVK